MNCSSDASTIARQWFAPIRSGYTTRVKNPTPKLSTLAARIAPESAHNASLNDAGGSGDAWAVHSKAIDMARRGEPIIFLSIGQEADEQTPQSIVQHAITQLETGNHHYSDVEGTPELRNAIAQYHQRLTGQSVTAEQCTVVSGAQNGLFAVAQVLLEPGCELVLSEPYYTTYPACFTANGAQARRVALRSEDNYRLNVDRLLAAVTPNTRAIVLNTPNNPMGECYQHADLDRIVQYCRERGVWLILDMVYAELVEPEQLALPHCFDGADDIIISIGSLSKSHRMTGWRAGWVVAPVCVAEALRNLSTCMHYGLPSFIMSSAAYALNNDRETPKLIRLALQRRREIINTQLAAHQGVHVIDSGQGMFVLLDIGHTGLTATSFAEQLLDETHVSVLPCEGFGAVGANLVRISLAVDELSLTKACHLIANFCVKHAPTN